MGRRNRRVSTHHAIRVLAPNATLSSYVGGRTWCGEDYGLSASLSNMAEGEDPLAYSRRSTDCPKCAAAIGKARMAQIGDRVRLEAATGDEINGSHGRKYRGLYRLFIDGTHRGWVVMQNGWGNPWELHELTDRLEDGWRIYGAGVAAMPDRYSKTDADRTFQMVHFYSKDMMASAALRHHERVGLPTVEEMAHRKAAERARREAEEAERAEARRVAEIERDRKTALRNERKELALDWLNAVLAQPDLTNVQRAGAQAAHDIITGKDVA